MDRDRQIELLKSAKERQQNRVLNWLKDAEIKAAVHRRPAEDHCPPENGHDMPRRRFG